MSPLFSIDWKRFHKKILPYLEGEGGFICVTGGKTAGISIFIELAFSQIETKMANIVRITPYLGSRTPEEIIEKFEGILGLKRQLCTPLEVAKDIKAKGNIDIHDILIAPGGTQDLYSRKKSITDQIEKSTDHKRMIITIGRGDVMPPETASWFWSEFWLDGIAKYVGKGSLLICACESGDETCHAYQCACSPTVKLNLLNEYGREELGYAKEDIVNILIDRQKTDRSKAEAQADMLLNSNHFRPSEVHAGLSAYFGNLGF